MQQKTKSALFAILMAAAFGANAQQAVYSYFYRQNWQLVNPAAMDRWLFFQSYNNSNIIINTGARQQWFNPGGGGFGKVAPKTAYASFEIAPATNNQNANNTIRFGGMATLDQTDAIGTVSFQGNFAYYFQLDRRHRFLSLGISAGYISSQVNAAKLRPADQQDGVIDAATAGRDGYADFSMGAFYRNGKRFYAGLSIPQVVSFLETEKTVLPFETGTPVYLVLGGFIVPGYRDYGLNTKDFKIEPSLWVRYASGVNNYNLFPERQLPLSLDADVRFYHRDQLWYGGGYGTQQVLNIEFGYMNELNGDNRIRIGMNYGIPLGRKYLHLGHSIELTFSYGIEQW